jgi:hypothetical protein
MATHATTPNQVAHLVTTAETRSEPPRAAGGRGRPPLYKPMTDLVVNKHPEVVVFGPLPGETGKSEAERIRTGCQSYTTDHPEELPEGYRMAFSIRGDGDEYRIYAWLEAKS